MRRTFALLISLVTTVALAATAQPAFADDGDRELLQGVSAERILVHERALQKIADHNGGIRAAGTPGYDAAAGYVVRTLRSYGYSVQQQPLTFPFYRELQPAVLAQVSPAPVTYEAGTLAYSGAGDVTAPLVPTTDVMVPPAPQPASTSGCEAADFPAVPAGQQRIALIQRGGCGFGVKAFNAQTAGYAGVVLFNEGQPGRDQAMTATIGETTAIPVLGVLSYADGAALHRAAVAGGGAVVRVAARTENIADARTTNVIAETRGGDPRKVLLVHAALDALPSGPGINGNGSGVSTMLEIARQLSQLRHGPHYKVRFVFFGGDETRAVRDPNTGSIGLLGSQHYVKSLTPERLARIFAAVHLDSLASPNYVRFVFDGSGPAGSEKITKLFTDQFAARGLATEPTMPTTWTGGQDFGPLMNAGIPGGGLFGGAADLKTPEQAAVYGGTAGEAYDACFHAACDTYSQLNRRALTEFGGVAAAVVRKLATDGLPA